MMRRLEAERLLVVRLLPSSPQAHDTQTETGFTLLAEEAELSSRSSLPHLPPLPSFRNSAPAPHMWRVRDGTKIILVLFTHSSLCLHLVVVTPIS